MTENDLTVTTTPPRAAAPSAPVHAPATDMIEFEDRLELHIDLPGIPRDGVEVKFEQGRLTIRAERTDRTETESAIAHREFGSARFRRAFAVPDGYDVDQIEAKMENGLLTLQIPKAARHRPRRIEIR